MLLPTYTLASRRRVVIQMNEVFASREQEQIYTILDIQGNRVETVQGKKRFFFGTLNLLFHV